MYRGRFAPTPSGELHFGSLVAALASFLDARANQGTWLVRIDDVDTTRARTDAITSILHCLRAHGMQSDEPVYYQSQHTDHYQKVLDQLLTNGLAFFCSCTRARLKTLDHQYDGHCLVHQPEDPTTCAVRLSPASTTSNIDDLIQGPQTFAAARSDHPVLKRRDGCFGYPLSMVIDDHRQRITHVVRGLDLLEETPIQLQLQSILGFAQPNYAHIGSAMLDDQRKLSKQNHAKPIDINTPEQNLRDALKWLNQPELPSGCSDIASILDQAVQNWRLDLCPVAAKLAPRSFCS